MERSRLKNPSKGRRGQRPSKVKRGKKGGRRKSKNADQNQTTPPEPREVLVENSEEPFPFERREVLGEHSNKSVPSEPTKNVHFPPEFDVRFDNDSDIFKTVKELEKDITSHPSLFGEHDSDLFERIAVLALHADRHYCYLSYVKEMKERDLKFGEHFLASLIEELEGGGLSDEEIARLQGRKAKMIKQNDSLSLKVEEFREWSTKLSKIRDTACSLFREYLTRYFYNPNPINESQGQMKIKLYGYDHPGVLIDARDVAVLRGAGYLSLSDAIILLTPYALPGSNMQLVDEDGTVVSDGQFICTEKDTVLLYKLEKTDIYSVMFAAQRFKAQYFRQDTFPDVLSCGAAIDIHTMDKEGFMYRFIRVGLNSKSSTSGATSDRIDSHFRQDLFCVPVVKEFGSATKLLSLLLPCLG